MYVCVCNSFVYVRSASVHFIFFPGGRGLSGKGMQDSDTLQSCNQLWQSLEEWRNQLWRILKEGCGTVRFGVWRVAGFTGLVATWLQADHPPSCWPSLNATSLQCYRLYTTVLENARFWKVWHSGWESHVWALQIKGPQFFFSPEVPLLPPPLKIIVRGWQESVRR